MVWIKEILILQFSWQASCQQFFYIETCHLTSWLLLKLCSSFRKTIFSSFLLLLETDQAEHWHVTTTHITTSFGRLNAINSLSSPAVNVQCSKGNSKAAGLKQQLLNRARKIELTSWIWRTASDFSKIATKKLDSLVQHMPNLYATTLRWAREYLRLMQRAR